MTTAIIIVIVLLLAVLGLAATRPNVLSVRRATQIRAKPDKIYDLISDFRNWGSWSPWEKLDPAMQRKLSGAESGKGAVYEWEGKGKVGAGRMEIIGATPPSKITIKLDFIRPFEGHNTAEFTLDANPAKAGATEVTWAMYGPAPYMAKLMGLFMNMDKMIGKDFETGLANLKSITER
jgi:hypothetical protein